MYGVVGDRFDVMPIALREKDTKFFEAGVIRIGVEGRTVDPEEVSEGLGELSPEAKAQIEANQPEDLDDAGPSIHILGTESGREFLRFDCFTKGPHYHYVYPEDGYQIVVMMDEAAHGNPIDFALHCLRHRLGPMLARAGQPELAGSIDRAAVEAVLPPVEAAARRELMEAQTRVRA